MLMKSMLTLVMVMNTSLAPAGTPKGKQNGGQATAPQGPEPGSMMPDIVPPAAKRDWKTEHRFLQAGTGVTWTLVGLGIIGMAIPLGMLSRCNSAASYGADVSCAPERRAAGITAPILGIMTLASLVPAVIFTRRLVRHKQERPVAALHVAPGGLVLRF